MRCWLLSHAWRYLILTASEHLFWGGEAHADEPRSHCAPTKPQLREHRAGRRAMFLEQLEERRVLATITVTGTAGTDSYRRLSAAAC